MKNEATKINTPRKDDPKGPTKMTVLDQNHKPFEMVLVPGLGFVFTTEAR